MLDLGEHREVVGVHEHISAVLKGCQQVQRLLEVENDTLGRLASRTMHIGERSGGGAGTVRAGQGNYRRHWKVARDTAESEERSVPRSCDDRSVEVGRRHVSVARGVAEVIDLAQCGDHPVPRAIRGGEDGVRRVEATGGTSG